MIEDTGYREKSFIVDVTKTVSLSLYKRWEASDVDMGMT